MRIMKNRYTLAKLFLTVTLALGPLAPMARAASFKTETLSLTKPASSKPIGRVESWGAVTINGQKVGRESLLWSGDLIKAPIDLGAQAALTEVGQVSVRPGSVIRLATQSVPSGENKQPDKTLVASLVSGDFTASLQPNVNARFDVNGTAYVSSRGASFRVILREDGVSVDVAQGSVMPVGSWAVALPKNIVREAMVEQAAAGQGAPRRYLIKPYNLGISADVRARSTRSLQVRVTDENDKPVPDAPVLFLLGGGGGGAGGAGNAAGLTLRATTNPNGVATVQYNAPNAAGSRVPVRVQVEGSDAFLEGTLNVIAAKAGFWTPQNAIPVFAAVGVGLGLGIYKVVTKDEPETVPPITQRPGGTVIVP